MGGTVLISATETSALLGKTVRTVQRLAKQGKLPIAQKMAGETGAYLFDRETIEAIRGTT